MARREWQVRVEAFAKVNLCLEVLNKRPDGFHNIRTVFQTISLSDVISIDYTPSSKTELTINSNIPIEDNLMLRAAQAVLQAMDVTAKLSFTLDKRIPMGGGLGGGSSDAAAVLMALPILADTRVPLPRLLELAATLGSDVPFFIMGGTALGVGRGTELYPIIEPEKEHLWLIAPEVQSSTPQAYAALKRTIDYKADHNYCAHLCQSLASGSAWQEWMRNDFQEPVEHLHPEIRDARSELARAGCSPVMMSGSGSCVFGAGCTSEPPRGIRAEFVNREEHATRWNTALAEPLKGRTLRQWFAA